MNGVQAVAGAPRDPRTHPSSFAGALPLKTRSSRPTTSTRLHSSSRERRARRHCARRRRQVRATRFHTISLGGPRN
eukprot:5128258-Prymnesium_polylepis.1